MTRTHHGRLRTLGAALALLVALGGPTAVLAATGGGGGPGTLTVSISDVKVIGKVIAEVRINVVCDPFSIYDPYTGELTTTATGSIEESNVTVLQAQGRAVASGSGSFFGPLLCDGSTVNAFVADVPATSLPWKNGSAVVSASAWAVDEFFQTGKSGTSGNVLVKLSTH